jgi:multidrug efflux pump subunit AcrA (membrane-fusion protein)
VSTVVARPGDSKRSVTLPATLQGRSEITLLARSGGYLAAWHKTIGERVRKGELLATIEAPEQDQELEQARAAREQVRARVELTRDTLKRWEHLASLDSVARQDLDESAAPPPRPAPTWPPWKPTSAAWNSSGSSGASMRPSTASSPAAAWRWAT